MHLGRRTRGFLAFFTARFPALSIFLAPSSPPPARQSSGIGAEDTREDCSWSRGNDMGNGRGHTGICQGKLRMCRGTKWIIYEEELRCLHLLKLNYNLVFSTVSDGDVPICHSLAFLSWYKGNYINYVFFYTLTVIKIYENWIMRGSPICVR